MQIEVYAMETIANSVQITLEAVCDSFSSLLWDVQYYECGRFEIYVAANARNIGIFQAGKIIGRDDDKQHYGIIETILLQTDVENGDYLTVSGRFLMSLLSRRIIYPTLSFTTQTSYKDMVQTAIRRNCITSGVRQIPGLILGESTQFWDKTSRLQVSYDNLMDWIYKICEITGGTANIILRETYVNSEQYTMRFTLSQGEDRSITQTENAHVVFSDSYCNLLNFSYAFDCLEHSNTAYIFGAGEGSQRKQTLYFDGDEPEKLNRYELYIDAKDVSQEDGEEPISDEDYLGLLAERGAENLVPIVETSESMIAADGKQYQYNKDYFVGDFVTVEHERFGLIQPKIQLTGMIESYDQNGRNLTPTFRNGG